MARFPKPLPSIPYLDPTNVAGATGTRLGGILDEKIVFEEQRKSRLFMDGLEDDAYVGLSAVEGPPLLRLPLVGNSVETLKILFAHNTTGGALLDSFGGEALDRWLISRTFAILCRPVESGELFLYSPAWVLHDESRAQIAFHRKEWSFEESELILTPTKVRTDAKAYMYDTAANIAGEYTEVGVGP